MSFKDFFSAQSAQYTQFRPRYPKELYSFLFSLSPYKNLAWDVGTGNGQAAIDLASHFTHVHATDASTAQIEKSIQHPRVKYAVSPAQMSGLPDQSTDLVTVAQALHWFDFSTFFAEVKRVLKPTGFFATWAYGFHESDDARLNSILEKFGKEILKDFWQPEPKLIWDDYQAIHFPFKILETPKLNLTVQWNLTELIGFISSWSATQKYLEAHKTHPFELVYDNVLAAWGDPQKTQTLHCPLVFKVGSL